MNTSNDTPTEYVVKYIQRNEDRLTPHELAQMFGLHVNVVTNIIRKSQTWGVY
jgi:plasmid maintenance system antidote protein VapI